MLSFSLLVPAFLALSKDLLLGLTADAAVTSISLFVDEITKQSHEQQLKDCLKRAFAKTKRQLQWKVKTRDAYSSFKKSLADFSGNFHQESLSKILQEAVRKEVTDDEVARWTDNLIRQLSLNKHTELREYLKFKRIFFEEKPIPQEQAKEDKYILTPNSSVCENEDIIGRDSFINDLLKLLESKNSRIQIAGMGGLGKTETLNKLYARLAKDKKLASFDHIGLIRFSGDILSDIQSQVNYPPEYLGLQGMEAAKRFLQDICQEKKVLLFFDDIREKQPLLDDHDPNVEFLRSLGASILLAARASFPGFEVHDLEFLPIDECIQIFERQYGRSVTDEKDRGILKDIIENRAGNHTMVVNRLGSIAKIYNWSILVLSGKLEEKNFNFAKSISNDELLQQEINKLYQMSDTLSEAEKNLLEAFSIFPAAPLSADLCVAWLHEDAGVDEDNCARLLNRLAEQTWLEKRCGSDNSYVSFLMHQLVRTAVQEQVKAQYTTHQMLEKKCSASLYTSTDNYELKKSSLFIPFAMSIFENLFHENLLFSVLAFNIANYYTTSANYKSALEWYMKDLTISEKLLGKDHPDIAKTYHNIASVFYDQGEYDLALEWYQKSLTIKEGILGKDHLDTADTYNNIALVYHDQGRYDLALEWHARALAIREITLEKDNPDTATSYNNIAIVYQNQGKYELALEWHQKALVIREKVLGKNHPDTLSTYHNIATIYSDQGEYSLALVLFQKTLTAKEEILGKDHPTTAATYDNIAIVYSEQGKYDLALEWYQKALAINEVTPGKNHPDTAKIYYNIAHVYQDQGKYDLALEWYLKALAIREKILGKDHLDTAYNYYKIGSLYKAQCKYSLAFKWLRKALPIFEMRLGSEHHRTTMTRALVERVQNIISSNLWNS